MVIFLFVLVFAIVMFVEKFWFVSVVLNCNYCFCNHADTKRCKGFCKVNKTLVMFIVLFYISVVVYKYTFIYYFVRI